ncbi:MULTISPECIES: sodium:proton antiporter NhaD [unclassified Flavobacterium]|jgi:Na+/H+ antiporter NhaD/arsenite permease-like protein|uniref:sodium:proton antiporter NhaD n=1 Tax=unclassified Flavobacterium TaxID=196869 RepID=UPI0025B93982|nr:MULTISPECIES: sodium:proton antiporter NhaD [unclassified Flavobacterium]
MEVILVFLFIIGYLLITLEHPLKLDKSVPALLMASIMWAVLSIGFNLGWFSIINEKGDVFNVANSNIELQKEGFLNTLTHQFSGTAEILIFLIGAMTIVELIDLHKGFDVIKNAIRTKSKIKLLWILGIIGFLLSSMIDNLTATIVLVTVLRKLIPDKEERLWFASLIIIATNAGGAWSPIGDVTTTMLWIGNKVTASGLMEYMVIPSIICFVVPFAIASRLKAFKGNVEIPETDNQEQETLLSSSKMLYLGLGAIIFVPIFKTTTHLPPYLGMIFSLGIVWLISEFIHPEENFDKTNNTRYSVHTALSRIEFSSILFFLGILLSVGSLETLVFGSIHNQPVHTLRFAAESLSNSIPNMDIVVILLGMFSSVIDNVPLVAATMGMYTFEIDSPVWHFIAYCAGTGGSMLIIGSAAGVAAMGMEKIDFIWYLKKITWLAFVGFMAGALCFIGIEHFFK